MNEVLLAHTKINVDERLVDKIDQALMDGEQWEQFYTTWFV